MEELIRFISLAQTDRFTITDLCEQFGISRKTAYKHLDRYAAGGWKALAPRSHRPHRSPERTEEAVEKLVLAERRRHRTWGPTKIQDLLLKKHGIEAPPACSTIGEMLRRHGLSVRRRRRPGAYFPSHNGLTVPTQPNQVWTVDFKGWFVLGNGERCDPLTVWVGPKGSCLTFYLPEPRGGGGRRTDSSSRRHRLLAWGSRGPDNGAGRRGASAECPQPGKTFGQPAASAARSRGQVNVPRRTRPSLHLQLELRAAAGQGRPRQSGHGRTAGAQRRGWAWKP